MVLCSDTLASALCWWEYGRYSLKCLRVFHGCYTGKLIVDVNENLANINSNESCLQRLSVRFHINPVIELGGCKPIPATKCAIERTCPYCVSILQSLTHLFKFNVNSNTAETTFTITRKITNQSDFFEMKSVNWKWLNNSAKYQGWIPQGLKYLFIQKNNKHL